MSQNASPSARAVLRGHTKPVKSVVFVPGRNQVVSGSWDGSIRTWSTDDGSAVGKVIKTGHCVQTMDTSRDGRYIASGGQSGKLTIWDTTTQERIIDSVEGHAGWVRSLAFAPDSRRLASGGEDKTVIIWDPETGKRIGGPFKGHTFHVLSVKFSSDGKTIASCGGAHVRISDSQTGQLTVPQSYVGSPHSLVWSSDDQRIFVSCSDGLIKSINPSTGSLLTQWRCHSGDVFSVAISENGSWLATASQDCTVRIWDPTTQQQIGPALQHGAKVTSLAISSDCRHLVSGGQDQNCLVWDVEPFLSPLLKVVTPSRNAKPDGHGAIQAYLYPSKTQNALPSQTDPMNGIDDSEGGGAASSLMWSTFQVRTCRDHRPDGPLVSLEEDSDSDTASFKSADLDSFEDPRQQESVHDTETQTNASGSGNVHKSDSPSSENRTSNIPPASQEPWQPSWNLADIRSCFPNDLNDYITQLSEQPIAYGGHANIYAGTLRIREKSTKVAIKVIKIYLIEGDDLSHKKKRLRREIKVWLELDHANILPLFGTTTNVGRLPALVCPWVENGALTPYLKHQHEKLTPGERLVLLGDIAAGLHYLHSKSIVHGDLSGGNVLVHGNGRACITDFGLSTLLTELEGTDRSIFVTSSQGGGTLRWAAPERLSVHGGGPGLPVAPASSHDARGGGGNGNGNGNGNGTNAWNRPTTKSDVYSFGSIMLQVLSGDIPYHYYTDDVHVILALARGETPTRPRPQSSESALITDRRWEFMKRCWATVEVEVEGSGSGSGKRCERPSAEEIVAFTREELVEVVLPQLHRIVS